jgi:hypothetical protein
MSKLPFQPICVLRKGAKGAVGTLCNEGSRERPVSGVFLVANACCLTGEIA